MLRSKINALLRGTEGNALVGFAFILPVLLGICFGIIEFSLLAFDFHRANEATRRIARQAAMTVPLVNETTLSNNGSATCTGSTACPGLTELTATAQAIFPAIAADNVAITYSLTGIGNLETLGRVKPLITVRLTGLRHDFILLASLPGAPKGLTFPAFSTSMLGVWYR